MGTPLPVSQNLGITDSATENPSAERVAMERSTPEHGAAETAAPVDATSAVAPTTPATTGVVSEDQVKLSLRRVKDPDLQLNVVDLGLIYGTRVDGTTVSVDMTLTSPGCPSGPEIMGDIEREVKTLPGVEQVNVNLLWTPFWTPDRIEPRVRAYLGL